MKFIHVILIVIFIAPIVAILTYSNHDSIKSIIDPPREKIRSVIDIGETCGVGKDHFEIVDLDTGHRVPVRNGKSRIETTEGNKIQLQISAQFQAVQIDIPPVQAEKYMLLGLDCGNDERRQNLLNSIKDNF